MYSYFSQHSAQQIINFKNCSLSLLCMQMGVFSHAHGLGLPLWFSRCSLRQCSLALIVWVRLAGSPSLYLHPWPHSQAQAAIPRTQVFMPVQQVPYPLSHHPCREITESSLSCIIETSNSTSFFLVNMTHQVDFLFSLDSSNKPFILFWESN